MKDGFFKFLSRFSRRRLRTIRGSKRRKSVHTERAGRNIKIVGYEKNENILAPLQTIINSIFNGKYDLVHRKFTIDEEDFVGWDKLQRESLTLIILVDVSQSTFPFIRVFAEILNSLTGYLKMHQDRIGLIALQGSQAKIMNHPTHNYRIVTKNLLKLNIRGETPLADGLLKAVTMANLEKYRKPGSRNIVILLSDCFPEPITGGYPDFFEEPAYRECVRAASIYRQNRISLLVINPVFKGREEDDAGPGERLADVIARASSGRLIKLYRHQSSMAADAYVPPSDSEIRKIIDGVEEMLGQRGIAETKDYYLR